LIKMASSFEKSVKGATKSKVSELHERVLLLCCRTANICL
jgi:hypothetical protein